MTYTVKFTSYCGMPAVPVDCENRADARWEAARTIRWSRNAGFEVTTLERGERWEVLEPEDCMMVPDECGFLRIEHKTFECRECGSEFETRDDAAACCSELFYDETETDDDV